MVSSDPGAPVGAGHPQDDVQGLPGGQIVVPQLPPLDLVPDGARVSALTALVAGAPVDRHAELQLTEEGRRLFRAGDPLPAWPIGSSLAEFCDAGRAIALRRLGWLGASASAANKARRAKNSAARAVAAAERPGKFVATPERAQHDDAERIRGQPDVDGAGAVTGVPTVVSMQDTLRTMLSRSTITERQYGAAREFQGIFQLAHISPLKAQDLTGVRVASTGAPLGLLTADTSRDRLDAILRKFGGHASLMGSCLWHVVGEQMTIKNWCLRNPQGSGRSLAPEAGSGVLIATLSLLVDVLSPPRPAKREPENAELAARLRGVAASVG